MWKGLACSKNFPELLARLPFVSQCTQMLHQFRKSCLTLGVTKFYLRNMEVSLLLWENEHRMPVGDARKISPPSTGSIRQQSGTCPAPPFPSPAPPLLRVRILLWNHPLMRPSMELMKNRDGVRGFWQGWIPWGILGVRQRLVVWLLLPAPPVPSDDCLCWYNIGSGASGEHGRKKLGGKKKIMYRRISSIIGAY